MSLLRYVLWCMQCSHDTGRTFAVMFFGAASSYHVLLNILDEQDGLRILYNHIGILKILQASNLSCIV
jgi:hypothetical protein